MFRKNKVTTIKLQVKSLIMAFAEIGFNGIRKSIIVILQVLAMTMLSYDEFEMSLENQ